MIKKQIIFLAILPLIYITALLIFHCNTQLLLFFDKFNDYQADFFNPLMVAISPDFYDINGTNVLSYRGFPLGHGDRMYPPIVYLLLRAFRYIHSYSENSGLFLCQYITTLSSVMFILVLYNNIKINYELKILLLITILFSGIFMFTLERANLILLVAALTSYFAFNYDSDNKLKKEMALICLALSAAIKISPCLLGLLLLYRKEYKCIFRAAVYTIFFFFVPFLLLDGGFYNNIIAFLYNMHEFTTSYYGRSIPYFISKHDNLSICFRFVCVSISILSVITNYYQEKTWKRYAQIVCAIYCISSTSAIYMVLYLYPVIVMFYNQKKLFKQDWLYFVLFALLLNPIIFSTNSLYEDTINMAMLVMLISLTTESCHLAYKNGKKQLLCSKKTQKTSL